jgi:hypothetical protein
LSIPVDGFDSDNLRSGTGEVRAWISVAAASDRLHPGALRPERFVLA